MKFALFFVAAVASVIACDGTLAQTKSERCVAYAGQTAGSTPRTTGVARGAVICSIGANTGRGTAVGAVLLRRMHEAVRCSAEGIHATPVVD